MKQIEIIEMYNSDSFEDFELRINKSIKHKYKNDSDILNVDIIFTTLEHKTVCILTKIYK